MENHHFSSFIVPVDTNTSSNSCFSVFFFLSCEFSGNTSLQLIKASHDNVAACNTLRKMLQCRVITDIVHVMKNPSFRLEIFQTGLFPNIWHFKNQTIAFGGVVVFPNHETVPGWMLSNSKILESFLVHRPQKISGLC